MITHKKREWGERRLVAAFSFLLPSRASAELVHSSSRVQSALHTSAEFPRRSSVAASLS